MQLYNVLACLYNLCVQRRPAFMVCDTFRRFNKYSVGAKVFLLLKFLSKESILYCQLRINYTKVSRMLCLMCSVKQHIQTSDGPGLHCNATGICRFASFMERIGQNSNGLFRELFCLSDCHVDVQPLSQIATLTVNLF